MSNQIWWIALLSLIALTASPTLFFYFYDRSKPLDIVNDGNVLGELLWIFVWTAFFIFLVLGWVVYGIVRWVWNV